MTCGSKPWVQSSSLYIAFEDFESCDRSIASAFNRPRLARAHTRRHNQRQSQSAGHLEYLSVSEYLDWILTCRRCTRAVVSQKYGGVLLVRVSSAVACRVL